LLDIGKNQTSYVVYEDGYSLGYGTIPLGWENVTKDIAIGMQVDIKDAEEMKRTLGTAVIDENTVMDTWLDIHFLTEIISARYEQIFLRVNAYLESIEKDGRLSGGAFLIGWGSKMTNLTELAKDVFKIVSSQGKDQILNLWDLSNNVQYLNVLWCYYRSMKYMDDSRKSSSFGGIGGKIVEFLKNLF
jgi:cell division protein FtsA